MATSPVMNIARKGVLAYVGALALASDQVMNTVDSMTRRGAEVEHLARKRLQRTLRWARSEAQDSQEQTQEQFVETRLDLARSRDRLLDTLNIPTQTSIAELNSQVARLNEQIDELRGTLRRRAAQIPSEPIPGYDKLNAEAVVERLAKLDEATLLAVRAHEQQRANRITVLRPLERTLVERLASRDALAEPAAHTTVEPFPRYSELRAEEIAERVADLNAAELLHVRVYEQEREARVTVLRAIDARMAAIAAA
ncbi:MAG TPA: phasin family protein [Roseiflexaceae bacterium]|nr:phasin family protein [Roseiflexaceae bacterium]